MKLTGSRVWLKVVSPCFCKNISFNVKCGSSFCKVWIHMYSTIAL